MNNATLDAEIRRCAFEFLQAATDRHGEVLPWSLLSSGMCFRGEIVPKTVMEQAEMLSEARAGT